jgi:AcrR family transcriptional regulator
LVSALTSGSPRKQEIAEIFNISVDSYERSYYKRAMGKGEETRQAIIDEAFSLASCIGVGGLSIGVLADRAKMSKSGLFAHFGSKEELQLAVLRESQARFSDVVLRPAMREPRGLARLRAIVRNWLDWTRAANLPGGCVINAAAAEFDDQPGPLRDEVRSSLLNLRHFLADVVARSVETGELREDIDIDQFVFELEGIYQITQQTRRLFNDTDADRRALVAFDRLVRDHATAKGKEVATETGFDTGSVANGDTKPKE